MAFNKLLYVLQKSLFQPWNLFKPLFSEKWYLEYIWYLVTGALNNILPPIFKIWFNFCCNIDHYSTSSSMKSHLHKKSFRANNFGKFSVPASAMDSWNKMQGQMGETVLKDLRPSKIKWILTEKFIKSYWLIFFIWILFILCEFINGYCIPLSL